MIKRTGFETITTRIIITKLKLADIKRVIFEPVFFVMARPIRGPPTYKIAAIEEIVPTKLDVTALSYIK